MLRIQRRLWTILVPTTLIFLLIGSLSRAQETQGAPDAEYFSLDDVQKKSSDENPGFEAPNELIQQQLHDVGESIEKSSQLSLVKWVRHEGAPKPPEVPYARARHFGGWVRPKDGECYNVRARVLIRDSSRAVEFRPNNRCVVDRGLWKDPYSGDLVESSRQIQIDHMVPLKDAYISGAHQWTPQKRCLYGNFMANSYHLKAVSGTENMRKSDRTPAEYLPPNREHVCEYLQEWLKIKLAWGLIMRQAEARAIDDTIREYRCRTSDMRMEKAELRDLRTAQGQAGACEGFTGERRPQLLN